MSTVIAVPSNIWTRLPGTEWEVFQDSGDVVFLGADDTVVHIRRAKKQPAIWGPRPPVVSVSADPDAENALILDAASGAGGGISR